MNKHRNVRARQNLFLLYSIYKGHESLFIK